MLRGVMRKFLFPGAAAAALLTLPAVASEAAAQRRDQSAEWRDVATDADRARLRGWRRTWVEGLREARRANPSEVEREGALLEPDAALLQPEPPPGRYLCRTLKLGNQSSRGLDWVAYPAFRCRITREGDRLGFVRLDGSQRPIGTLYSGGARRMIFLGSLQLGDERQVLPYGTDSLRDMAGMLERVGERRWRLVFPRPAFESIIDVIELVPAS